MTASHSSRPQHLDSPRTADVMIRNRARTTPRLILSTLLAALMLSCTAIGHQDPGPESPLSGQEAQLARLESDLTLLLGYRDRETVCLAQTVLSATDRLARDYRVQPPALWHNFLVNVGLRDRGLCCHWTQDLLRAIEALGLKKYDASWGVSRYGTWREHNSVVVTAAGQDFEAGVVLDPWRNAGDLHWAPVATDVYPWQRHPGDRDGGRIRCR